MSRDWTFLTKHAAVLLAISVAPGSTVEDIAEATDLSRRWVVKILNDLSDAGYVERERSGQSFLYTVESSAHLRLGLTRHADVAHLTVLLESDDDATQARRNELATELGALRRDVAREQQLLSRLTADRLRLAQAIAAARTALGGAGV